MKPQKAKKFAAEVLAMAKFFAIVEEDAARSDEPELARKACAVLRTCKTIELLHMSGHLVFSSCYELLYKFQVRSYIKLHNATL